jgi:RNA polymerase-binding transcription factor DksA
MSTSIHSQAEDRLRTEREHLVHQLFELGATETGELRGDVDFGDGFADAAAATAERTEVLGLIDSIHSSLVDVDAALARIEDGNYGTCAKCGKPIDEARLEFRPASIYCVGCKSSS